MKLVQLLVYVVCQSIAMLAHAQSSGPANTVVFVCEHGAAKSVLAAAYFNKLATQRHLDIRAVPRGVTPQQDLSVSTVRGLKKDGVDIGVTQPAPLTKSDAQGAMRVVAFLQLPKDYEEVAKIEIWNSPEVADDYDKARDIIVQNVDRLLSEIEKHSSADRNQH